MTENHDFKAPRPMTNKKGQDPNLYCDFHKDSGHLTDDCYSLRQEIERALKSGKLSHLVKNVRKETRQLQRHDEGNHKKVRRLETHMVNGPRYIAKEKGKRPYESSWQEQQVIFPVVRGGPRATRPVVITGRYDISLGADKTKAMNEQVCELLKAGILREVRYQSWVANPVMVEKSNGGWRMCVDYTDLNKACPNDCYSLSKIDKKIDSLAPYRWKFFLDCYKGYHQVQMKLEDEDKTTFRTDLGIFCYTKMPFGLKNAGATYQRLMDKTFAGDIGKHIEVYIDDLVVKSPEEDQMLKDIEKTFNSLRSVNMKLNPAK
ncbi:putative nucleotidyltransferase, Ribonuclease H [Helianthus annuus]|nr:putative nucleotidyltransferase, Ribonuclease H [Helianthus annuus]